MADEHPTPAPQGPVEYLGGVEPARKGRSRSGLVAGGAAAVVALGAAGAWGVASFMGGGQEAADVVPADALAYVSLDLDPDGGQKLEAYQTLKKFPALADKLSVSSGGEDLQRAVVEGILDEADCDTVSYEDDVAPWLGGALAVAAVPGDEHPQPVGLLQVTDEDAAVDGLAALAECSHEDDAEDLTGTAFADGWLVVAETDAQAQAVVDDAAAASLADDAGYQKWVQEAGGSGVLTAYVAAEGATALLDAASTSGSAHGTTLSEFLSDDAGPSRSAQLDGVKDVLDDFEGGAAVLRFEDEALEVQSAFGGLPDLTTPGGDSGLGDLPETTAVAHGLAVSDTFVQDLVDAYSVVVGEDEVDQFLQQGEQLTGLALPEDLQALLGDGVALALDGSADFASGASSPADVPVGLRIKGDPAEVVPALDKVLGALALVGLPAGWVQVEEGDGAVGVALDADRAAALAGDGALGDDPDFREALPDIEKSGTGTYVDLDEGDWFTGLVAMADDDELEANVEPLHTLGITGWSEDGTSHGLLRVTTD